jgi:hypothetical protein
MDDNPVERLLSVLPPETDMPSAALVRDLVRQTPRRLAVGGAAAGRGRGLPRRYHRSGPAAAGAARPHGRQPARRSEEGAGIGLDARRRHSLTTARLPLPAGYVPPE